MDETVEIIALLLAAASERRWHAGEPGEGAQCLIRMPDGRVWLEPVASEKAFERSARATDCFRRGKPVLDPQTHEFIGREMEQVPLLSGGCLRPFSSRSRAA